MSLYAEDESAENNIIIDINGIYLKIIKIKDIIAINILNKILNRLKFFFEKNFSLEFMGINIQNKTPIK